MSPIKKTGKQAPRERQRGFSMLEMMVTLVIFLGVAGIVMTAMMQMTNTQGSVANRTAMHSSVRSATELLQQEIGQAGKIALPTPANGGPTKMVTAITSAQVTDPLIGYNGAVVLDKVGGVYNGMLLVVDSGDQEETVAVTNLIAATKTFTGTFYLTHAAGNVPVRVAGAFASGIILPSPWNTSDPSDGKNLKMYGDINDDGNMVYVVYKCDTRAGAGQHRLSRSVAAYNDAAPGSDDTILDNITDNPPDPGQTGPAPCFKYQVKSVSPNDYVVDVSVTLTVLSQNLDPQTHQIQQETKALLNVSPRNIFEGWELAGAGVANRIQPPPGSVATLSSATVLVP
jgi:prepilin-type N-terminal cleavage/methylation domain-containing protein